MTDRPDFEPMLERRLQAYAARAVRPAHPAEIARTTIQAATVPLGRTSLLRGPRRPMLLLGMAAVLLAAVVGAAFIGGRTPAIQGAFVDGPSLDGGLIADAVALPDGRVLVGVRPEEGTVPGTTTLRCSVPCRPHLELLDPRTGVFSDTAATPAGLTVESLAPLHDGRVLIINESSDTSARQPATIYDPVADRFEETGTPVEPRTWPLLVTLADGRVLVAGDNVGNAALTTAELFDPATGTFSMAGSMTRPRGIGASAVLLRDGRVLIAGGGAEVGDSAELFDPATGMFTPTGSMTVARGGFFSATLLDDGRVLIAGGLVLHPTEPTTIAPEPAATAEIYDPATGTFTAVGSMAAPRYMHAASILTDGTVLVAGGSHERPPEGGVPATTDAEIFDPATGAFRPTGSLHRGRLMPDTVAVDDRVLVLGSFDPASEYPVRGRSTEWFD
jgi:hypothetical protein